MNKNEGDDMKKQLINDICDAVNELNDSGTVVVNGVYKKSISSVASYQLSENVSKLKAIIDGEQLINNTASIGNKAGASFTMTKGIRRKKDYEDFELCGYDSKDCALTISVTLNDDNDIIACGINGNIMNEVTSIGAAIEESRSMSYKNCYDATMMDVNECKELLGVKDHESLPEAIIAIKSELDELNTADSEAPHKPGDMVTCNCRVEFAGDK